MSNATEGPVADPGGGSPDIDRTESTASDSGLDREDAYEVLSNARRRHVIHCLLQREGGISLRELSRQLAAWENDVDPHEVSSKQRKRVYTALHQSHLPKLDETGVIEYDSNRSVVTPTDRLSDLRLYLEVVPDDEIPWSVYYTGIGVISSGAVLLSWLGLFPFSELGGFVWAGLLSLLVTISGIVHIMKSKRHELGTDGPPPELRN